VARPSAWWLFLGGLLGVLVGLEEGLELNVLGLTVGIDPNDAGLKLPLAGRLGFGDGTVARPVRISGES
jgi:hypothetical protein